MFKTSTAIPEHRESIIPGVAIPGRTTSSCGSMDLWRSIRRRSGNRRIYLLASQAAKDEIFFLKKARGLEEVARHKDIKTKVEIYTKSATRHSHYKRAIGIATDKVQKGEKQKDQTATASSPTSWPSPHASQLASPRFQSASAPTRETARRSHQEPPACHRVRGAAQT